MKPGGESRGWQPVAWPCWDRSDECGSTLKLIKLLGSAPEVKEIEQNDRQPLERKGGSLVGPLGDQEDCFL